MKKIVLMLIMILIFSVEVFAQPSEDMQKVMSQAAEKADRLDLLISESKIRKEEIESNIDKLQSSIKASQKNIQNLRNQDRLPPSILEIRQGELREMNDHLGELKYRLNTANAGLRHFQKLKREHEEKLRITNEVGVVGARPKNFNVLKNKERL